MVETYYEPHPALHAPQFLLVGGFGQHLDLLPDALQPPVLVAVNHFSDQIRHFLELIF